MPTGQGLPSDDGPIVIVDDDAFIVQALEMVLGAWGYAVVSAQSVERLEARLPTLDTAPVLVIADHFLPGGRTGAEVVALVRRHAGHAVPAILLTGDSAPEREAEAAAGGFRLLLKPVLPGPLRAVVEELVLRG